MGIDSNLVEVRNDEQGGLDEVVAFDSIVHLERMDKDKFFLIVETAMETVGIDLIALTGRRLEASVSWREPKGSAS